LAVTCHSPLDQLHVQHCNVSDDVPQITYYRLLIPDSVASLNL